MASSRVMASSSPPQPAGAGSSSDLARYRTGSGIGSMNMDDIIRNIYGPEAVNAAATGGGAAEPSPAAPLAAARRTSEEVWKEISAAGGLSAPALPPPPPTGSGAGARGAGGGAAEMTLEDFLARDSGARAAAAVEGNMALGFPVPDVDAAAVVGGGRGSRKRAMVDPEDRAVMQRQKRMIKNRESAARSRDRKQAYVAELESQVAQLEEEQAELLREQEERRQKRLKEDMPRDADDAGQWPRVPILMNYQLKAEEQLIPIFHDKEMRQQALSYVFIAANVILHSRQLSVQINHLNQLLPPVLQFLTSHHHSLRGFTQLLVHSVLSRLWPTLHLETSEDVIFERRCFQELKDYLAENSDCVRCLNSNVFRYQ